jgi:predicted PurR-regulated permease PerM
VEQHPVAVLFDERLDREFILPSEHCATGFGEQTIERMGDMPAAQLSSDVSFLRHTRTKHLFGSFAMSPSMRQDPFFLGLLGAISVAFFALLIGFWESILWAAVIGILFRPVQRRLTARLNGRTSLAAVLTVILIFFTVIMPAMLLASAVAAEAGALYKRIQSGELDVGALVRWVQSFLPQAQEWSARIGVDLDALPDKLSATALKGSQFVGSLALRAGQNVASFVLMFFLMLYLLFFILRDGDVIMQHVYRAMPLADEQERRLFSKFAEVSRATVKGTLVVALVQGSLGGVIFVVLGIEGAVFWGVVMAILSLLPAVGAGLVWVPAAILLYVSDRWVQGTILMAYGVLVIGTVDNLLRPILVGRDTKMPDYVILFSTLGGLSVFGITGFVLGPVIAALFIAGWQMYEQDPSAAAAEQTVTTGPDLLAKSTVVKEPP